MKCTRTDFHIQWLHNDAALPGPVVLQGLDNFLKSADFASRLGIHLK
jgi:hypothetical protein